MLQIIITFIYSFVSPHKTIRAMMFLNAKNIPYLDIEFQMFALDKMADQLKDEGSDVIKLTLGKSELPLPKVIKNVFKEKMFDPVISQKVCPEGIPELRNAIVEYYSNRGIGLHSNQIVVNSGTSPLVKDLLQVFVEKGEEVLLPMPYYPLYLFSSLLARAKIKFYNICNRTGSIDIDSFKKNFSSNTKIIFINTPGNPLGNVIEQNQLEEIINIVADQALILSDEMYQNVSFTESCKSILHCNNIFYDNIIVLNGFSKAFKMYTKRVGYLIMPLQFVNHFRILQQYTLLTADPVSQYACAKILECESDVRSLVELYDKRKLYTIEILGSCEYIDLIIPRGGFYFTINCQKYIKKCNFGSSKDLAIDILNKTGVAVVPGSDFGIDFAIRLSFTNERYKEAIDLLFNYFNKIED